MADNEDAAKGAAEAVNIYMSYPDGYEKLAHHIIPFYLLPMKKKLMGLLLTILSEE